MLSLDRRYTKTESEIFRIMAKPSSSRLPRLGGGVSGVFKMAVSHYGSSPPRRGCFRLIDFVMNYFFDESHYEII